MADNQFRSISDSWWKRIKDAVQYVEMNVMGASVVRRRRTAIGSGDGTVGPGDPSGGAGSGCCCNEANCLPEIPGVATKPKPDYRVFPYIFVCGCEGGGTGEGGNGGSIRMYRATEGNDDVWEQQHGSGDDVMMCRYPDCTSTGTWEWNGTGWDMLTNSNPGCGTPPAPDYSGTSVGQPAETEFVPASYPAYWRETHLPKDANGCDQSKLELIIEDGS